MLKMPKRHLYLLLAIVFLLAPSAASFAQSGRTGSSSSALGATGTSAIPAPESVLGFKIGEERKLAKWDQFVAYFQRLSETSDRIKLDTLGKTTLGRPFIAATISSPE